MSEDKKDIAGEWIRFKLQEALKKDPLYKDNEKKKAVMKDDEVDVHDGISDFLSRVLSKDDIKKFNYLNGFNPEREIHKEVVPNPEKEKIKESVSIKEDGADNVENTSVANEDEPVFNQLIVSDVTPEGLYQVLDRRHDAFCSLGAGR